jgi:hypothetical protein
MVKAIFQLVVIHKKSMPALKTYDLFISHAWKYNEDYHRLIKILQNASNFTFRNYSVPEHDPLIDPNTKVGRGKLEDLIDNQIRPVHCVLILSGMYASHSDWVLREIELGKAYKKPIIGIVPRGQERIPVKVQEAALDMVYWNTDSIVSAIRNYSI